MSLDWGDPCGRAYEDIAGDDRVCGHDHGDERGVDLCEDCEAREMAYWRVACGYIQRGLTVSRADILDGYSDDPAKRESMLRVFAAEDARRGK